MKLGSLCLYFCSLLVHLMTRLANYCYNFKGYWSFIWPSWLNSSKYFIQKWASELWPQFLQLVFEWNQPKYSTNNKTKINLIFSFLGITVFKGSTAGRRCRTWPTRYLSVDTLTRIRSSPMRTFSPSDLCLDAGWMVHQQASPIDTTTHNITHI